MEFLWILGIFSGGDFSGAEKNEEPGGKQAKLFSTFFTKIKKWQTRESKKFSEINSQLLKFALLCPCHIQFRPIWDLSNEHAALI